MRKKKMMTEKMTTTTERERDHIARCSCLDSEETREKQKSAGESRRWTEWRRETLEMSGGGKRSRSCGKETDKKSCE
jgi:hypothetical protein